MRTIMVEQEYIDIDETSERILHYREYIIFRKFNHVDFYWEPLDHYHY